MTRKAKPKVTGVYERVSIDAVKIDEKNLRTHPERNLDAIKASLETFGQRKPIVVNGDGVVLAGNGTLAAAKLLGWTHIDIARCTDLTPEQERAYSIADNKTTDLSEWDYNALADTMKLLPAELHALTGFADYELAPLLDACTLDNIDLPDEPGSDPPRTEHHTLAFTVEQWEAVEAAIHKIREDEHDESLSGAQSIVLLAQRSIAT